MSEKYFKYFRILIKRKYLPTIKSVIIIMILQGRTGNKNWSRGNKEIGPISG